MPNVKERFRTGHLAPKGRRENYGNSIEIKGDFHYCVSHHFIYNAKIEEDKLYMGMPCHYTDGRYYDGGHNYAWNTYLKWTRWVKFSIKSAVRLIRSCRNIPVGTIVKIGKSWYVPGSKHSNDYNFKVRKENKFDPEYEVNLDSFAANFETCEYSQKLTEALRANGFLVSVSNYNPGFLTGLVDTAAEAINPNHQRSIPKKEQTAQAWGHGKQIGFSSHDNDLYGYTYGIESILFDCRGYFDKWSRCHEIKKGTPIEEVLETLMSPNTEFYDDYEHDWFEPNKRE